MDIFNTEQIVSMYKCLEVSMAVFDRDMKMVYMNDKSHEFYKKMFGASDLLGKDLKSCHANINVKNIEALFQQFENGKPFSFISADVPIFEGGHLSVLHLPIKVDGKVVGIMEMPMETSFIAESGNGSYVRTYEEDDHFLDYSDMKVD